MKGKKYSYFKALCARLSLALSLAVVLCVSALASEGSGSTPATVDASEAISGITEQMTSGLASVVPAILAGLGALAAAGLVIFGAKFAVSQGLGMFRKVTGKN